MSAGRRRRITMVGSAGCLIAIAFAVAPAGAATPRAALPVLVAQPTPSTTSSSSTTTPPPTTAAPTDPFQSVTGPTPVAAATAHVAIIDYGFSPSTITVTAGTTVVWTNTGQAIHSVTSDTGLFDSSPTCPDGACIDPGATFSHTFATAGQFSYHCRVHSNMHGTVIVTAATPSTTTTVAGPTTTGAPGVSAASTPGAPTTAAGAQLAFTGSGPDALWLAFGALLTLAAGLALRPRRRPFPIPVPADPPRPD